MYFISNNNFEITKQLELVGQHLLVTEMHA